MPQTTFVRYGDDTIDTNQRSNRVIALVPSEAVVIREVTLPSTSTRHLERLVRYAVEESLAEDPEQLHFQIDVDKSERIARVMAAHQDDLTDWLAWFREKGIEPDAVLPDFYALPCQQDGWTADVRPERALIRKDRYRGFALAPEMLADCLPDDLATETPRLYVHNGETNAASADSLRNAGWQIVESSEAATPFLPNGHGLLTGRHHNNEERPYVWSAAAALIILALGIELGGDYHRQQVFEREAQRLEDATHETLRAAVPGITRIVDPEAQAVQALSQMNQLEQRRNQSFLQMLDRVAATLDETGSDGILRLTYRDGIMTVVLANDESDKNSGAKSGTASAIDRVLIGHGLDVRLIENRLQIQWKKDA